MIELHTDLAVYLAFSCVLLHLISVVVLARNLPRGSSTYDDLFAPTSPFLTGAASFPSLKLKFWLPWIPNPDITECGRAARIFLLSSRFFAAAFALLAVLTLVAAMEMLE